MGVPPPPEVVEIGYHVWHCLDPLGGPGTHLAPGSWGRICGMLGTPKVLWILQCGYTCQPSLLALPLSTLPLPSQGHTVGLRGAP